MKTNTHYETPTTELTKINLEQGFLVDSMNQNDSGILDLVEDDFSSIWGS